MTEQPNTRLNVASGHPCPYCGNRLHRTHPKRGDAPTRDHVVPQSQGGKLTIICCRKCNADKGDLSVAEWATILIMRRDFRAKRVSQLAADLQNGTRIVLSGTVIGALFHDTPIFSIGLAGGVFA